MGDEALRETLKVAIIAYTKEADGIAHVLRKPWNSFDDGLVNAIVVALRTTPTQGNPNG